MTGLEIVDAIMLFFGYIFVAFLPMFCVFRCGGEASSNKIGALFSIALIWLVVILSTLFSMHDFIFYLGVVGS